MDNYYKNLIYYQKTKLIAYNIVLINFQIFQNLVNEEWQFLFFIK